MILPQDKFAWIVIELFYICWLPNLVQLWHLKMIKAHEVWSSDCRQDVWLKCLTRRYALVMLLLGKALRKVSMTDSKENGKNSRSGTHLYCWVLKLLAWSHIEWSCNWMIKGLHDHDLLIDLDCMILTLYVLTYLLCRGIGISRSHVCIWPWLNPWIKLHCD